MALLSRVAEPCRASFPYRDLRVQHRRERCRRGCAAATPKRTRVTSDSLFSLEPPNLEDHRGRVKFLTTVRFSRHTLQRISGWLLTELTHAEHRPRAPCEAQATTLHTTFFQTWALLPRYHLVWARILGRGASVQCASIHVPRAFAAVCCGGARGAEPCVRPPLTMRAPFWYQALKVRQLGPLPALGYRRRFPNCPL